MNYFKDSIEEIKKVTWPTRNRAIQITIITIVFTFIATVILTAVDFAFKSGYDYLTDISPKLQNESSLPEAQVDLGSIQATDSEGNPVNLPITPSN
jgi:preprotein translocase SecE subunit